jgi:hypothetical protein
VTIHEHDEEPVHGLPALLPERERVLWQGAPEWKGLARRGFHVVAVTGYFLALGLWQGGSALLGGEGAGAAALSFALPLVPGALAVGLLSTLAWLYARETVYTITTRRVVIRTGLAVTASVNLPFTRVAQANVRRYGDGSGDLALGLDRKERVSWLLLWPNVRAWRMRQPEPQLRNVADVEAVARVLADALHAQAPGSVRAPVTARTPAPVPGDLTPATT